MKVILQKDVKGHGKAGELVEASDGFARNYLLPRKLAIEANAANLNTLKTQDEAKKHRAEEELENARRDGERLNGKTITLRVKTGAGGKLFGSVTTKEISDAIKAECGAEVNKQKITVTDAVKAVGTYEVRIKLHPEVSVKLTLCVTEEK